MFDFSKASFGLLLIPILLLSGCGTVTVTTTESPDVAEDASVLPGLAFENPATIRVSVGDMVFHPDGSAVEEVQSGAEDAEDQVFNFFLSEVTAVGDGEVTVKRASGGEEVIPNGLVVLTDEMSVSEGTVYVVPGSAGALTIAYGQADGMALTLDYFNAPKSVEYGIALSDTLTVGSPVAVPDGYGDAEPAIVVAISEDGDWALTSEFAGRIGLHQVSTLDLLPLTTEGLSEGDTVYVPAVASFLEGTVTATTEYSVTATYEFAGSEDSDEFYIGQFTTGL